MRRAYGKRKILKTAERRMKVRKAVTNCTNNYINIQQRTHLTVLTSQGGNNEVSEESEDVD